MIVFDFFKIRKGQSRWKFRNIGRPESFDSIDSIDRIVYHVEHDKQFQRHDHGLCNIDPIFVGVLIIKEAAKIIFPILI